jgi:hypothetical protein
MAARNGGPVDLSPSTIYRWVSAGYDGMTNMELRRKVGVLLHLEVDHPVTDI